MDCEMEVRPASPHLACNLITDLNSKWCWPCKLENHFLFSQPQTNCKPLTIHSLYGFDTFGRRFHSVSSNLQAKGRFQPTWGVTLRCYSTFDCLDHRSQTNCSIAPVILPTIICQWIFSSCQFNTFTKTFWGIQPSDKPIWVTALR